MASYPHVNEANKYARDIVSGKIPACVWVVLACQRHLDDVEKEKDKSWPYRFDKDKAERVCKFIELLPHVKGEWKGGSLTLESWQKFITCCVFGWVRKSDGYRRFRTVYIEVPRKNGKSTWTAAIGLYMMAADGEQGADCYAAATTRDQTRAVFAEAAQPMAKQCNAFREHYGVQVNAHNINVLDSFSKFEALSADYSTLDSLNVHFASVDELHAHKTRGVFEVLETATGARTQPLLWNITTAGTNKAGICYEQRTYVTKILQKTATDETYFGIIYTIDKDDDWKDESSWKKANPNYGISAKEDDFKRKAQKAMQLASATNGFLTKHLNIWVNADTLWLPPGSWEKKSKRDLTLDQFENEPVIISFDLASKIDIAVRMMLFQREDDFYCIPKFYIPEIVVEESENSQYIGWAKDGHFTTTPGNIIDFEWIENDLIALRGKFKLDRILNPARVPRHIVLYDPFQATEFSTRMTAEGFPMVEYGATVRNFSEPMKQLGAMILNENDGPKIYHDGNPVMNWMMSNVVCHVDAKDNIYPRKEFPEYKIDGPVALIMAIGWAMRHAKKKSVYSERGMRVI